MPHWIGLDLGGTNLRAALVDLTSGALQAIHKAPTPALEGPRAVLSAIVSMVEQVRGAAGLQAGDIAAVGIGCPARIDLARGVLMVVPNIPGDWPAIPFKRILEEETGLPVHPINDVRAITLGESAFGAGRGVDTLACYAIGTGIGGGVIVNGRLHLGLSGSAGELGHQIVDPFGSPCNCGSRGCLETISSGPAIAAAAAHALIMRRPSCMAEFIQGDLTHLTPAVVIEAARKGDAVALEIIERAGFYLGVAIVNTLVNLSPRRVLIGGGVAAAGEILLEPIRRTVRQRAFMVPVDEVEIVPAALGDTAGLLGSALWACSREQPAG